MRQVLHCCCSTVYCVLVVHRLHCVTHGRSAAALLMRGSTTPQVLQVPVLKPKHAKKLLQGVVPRIPLLGNSSVPTTEDKLDEFLQHVGALFGRDPNKWDKVGETKTDVTEQDGKRIIRRTGMYTGTELHLFVTLPHHDPRLPPRPDQPKLDFTVKCKEVTTTEEWQKVRCCQQPATRQATCSQASSFVGCGQVCLELLQLWWHRQ